jgi:hypothetical protein
MSQDKKRKGSFKAKFSMFCLLLLAAIFFPSTILLGTCMIPTFIAFLTDSYRQKTAGVTVGALNLAASIPAWLDLWKSGHQVDNAINIVTRSETLLYAYSGAAAGWFILLNVPRVISGVAVRKSEKRLKDIEKRRQELARKWGPEVAAK